jgi:hypothetical protein
MCGDLQIVAAYCISVAYFESVVECPVTVGVLKALILFISYRYHNKECW